VSNALYAMPTTVSEALKMAASAGAESLFIAGGTDVQTCRKQQLEQRSSIIDLSGIKELRKITVEHDRLIIGSMCTLDELIRSGDALAWSPLLGEAARHVASPTIRYTATVAGNLLVSNRCTSYNQSELWRESVGSCLRATGPTCLVTGGTDKCYARNVSDLAPAVIVLDGQVEVCDAQGTRVMPVLDLYVADGLQAQAGLPVGAIVTAVRVGIKPVHWYYRKLRQRESVDYTSLTVAGALWNRETMRVCINGVSMAPLLFECNPKNTSLTDLQNQAKRACKTVDNDLMALKYRRRMIDVYLEQLWQEFTT
jgi:4-hydroxybenzoyl-CoA reductase subunit beta